MGFTFFILLLGALVFTLSQKHEATKNRKYRQSVIDQAKRKAMGYGRDNIYQFKLYCYNIRHLLSLAQSEGVGIGEKLDEKYYDKHCNEISVKYCDNIEPTDWAMHKAIDTVMDQNYVSAWIYNSMGDEYYDERDLAHGIYQKRVKNQRTWSAFKSGYNNLIIDDRIKGILLPKDGVTNADYILRALYNYNHAFEFQGINGYKEDLDYFARVQPYGKYNKSVPYFEESGITLYN